MIEQHKLDYDKVKLIYNKWVSALSYEASIMEVVTADALKNARASHPQSRGPRTPADGRCSRTAKFSAYEVDDDELISDLASFALANAVFSALVEGHAAEISARRNGQSSSLSCPHKAAHPPLAAMDNASTNASDVIGKLSMQFNRMRQTQVRPPPPPEPAPS